MAGINWTKTGISAGVGVVDEVLERQDRKAIVAGKPNRAKPFQSYADIGRLVLAGGGFAMQAFTKEKEIGEALALSATPLLVKAIAKAAMPLNAADKIMGEAFAFTPRRRVSYGGAPVSAPPPQFEGDRVY